MKDDKVGNKTCYRKKGNGKKESKKEGLNRFATKNIIKKRDLNSYPIQLTENVSLGFQGWSRDFKLNSR